MMHIIIENNGIQLYLYDWKKTINQHFEYLLFLYDVFLLKIYHCQFTNVLKNNYKNVFNTYKIQFTISSMYGI